MTQLPPGGSGLDAIGPGTVLREWRVERFIARGAFGRVYEARRISWADDGSTRALKVFDPILSSAARGALMGEFRVLAQVRHPNVLRGEDAFDIGEGPLAGCVVFVLERGDADLAHDLAEHGPFATPAVARVGVAVARGLGALHERGQLHGDVKPENILRVGGVWKLGDFGVTTALEGSYATPAAATLDYRPPETSDPDSSRRVHRSADVWALGVALWVGATGRHPFVGDDAPLRYAAVVRGDRRPRIGIDPVLASVLDEACLARDPRDRATAPELARALGALTDGSVAPPRQRSPHDPGRAPTLAHERTQPQMKVAPGSTSPLVSTPVPSGHPSRHPGGGWALARSAVVSGAVAAVVAEAASLAAATTDLGLTGRRAVYAILTAVALTAAGGAAVRLRRPSPTQIAAGALAVVVVVGVATIALFGAI